MWEKLKHKNKEKYKTFICNFASLSEAFSQKAEITNDNESFIEETVAPIVNSKFQETVFQKSFEALGEDIANTSYDASLKLDEAHKYLVGIKSFGINSGDQKIAQFKSNSVSDNWEHILNKIKENSQYAKNKEEANALNHDLYLDLAIKISVLRNARIASSKEQIKGFKVSEGTDVEAVYHVLMPSKKGDKPQIFVGETDYSPIDIDNLQILGATSKNTPTNFKFTDGHHQYKYTSADSQLYMTFNNKDIVLETWDINYIKDPFSLFENLHIVIKQHDESAIERSVSWMIANKDGNVEENSGFNAFDGSSKLNKQNNYREKRIERICQTYRHELNLEQINYIKEYLEKILLSKWTSRKDKQQMKKLRSNFIKYIEQLHNDNLLEEIGSMLYRPVSEMYIPIPNAKNFHTENPDFFGKNIGLFQQNSSKLLLTKDKRKFNLEFMASGDSITAYINQESGKAIQSYHRQDILGEWILRGIFQLAPREPLTGKKLNDIGINAIRLSKFKDINRGIGLEFIWISPNDPPKDAIGWVSKNKKTYNDF